MEERNVTEKAADAVDKGADHAIRLPSTQFDEAVGVVQEVPKTSWRSYIWDSLDRSPEERRFLLKLDTVVLTFASLTYFIKNLDQYNINNAFVSGMKEDLGLYGNELNYIITSWVVGYTIGQIPSNLILTRVRPSIWMPACETVWSVLTITMVKCNTTTQICVIRFFIGLAESTFYPGMQYIIGSWYRSSELAKRSCLFQTCNAIGSMFSGYLMAGVYRLGGKGGLAGWQWLFVVDFIISLPIALAGFWMLPDVPETTRAWFLSPAEVEMAQRRMKLEGRAGRAPFTRAKVSGILRSWHIWLLTSMHVLFNNGNSTGGQPVFQLWLKSQGYSVTSINTLPTLTPALQVVTTLAFAWASDSFLGGERWPPIVFAGLVNIVVFSNLTAWNIAASWKFACFVLSGVGGGISGLMYAWAHEICAADNEERALVTGSMNAFSFVVQAWLPLIVWQQVEQPRYPKGFPTLVGIAAAMIVNTMVVRHLRRKELLRSRLQARSGVVCRGRGDSPAHVNEDLGAGVTEIGTTHDLELHISQPAHARPAKQFI